MPQRPHTTQHRQCWQSEAVRVYSNIPSSADFGLARLLVP